MNIDFSIGEAVDKYSILELKYKKIEDETKKHEIQKELHVLQECMIYKEKYAFYYHLLMYVNETIWDKTDRIKQMTITNENALEYALLSRDIFDFNQKRFRIKNWFNLFSDSRLKEQKSYASTHCKLIIENEPLFYSKLAEINCLSLEYDLLTIDCPFPSIVRNIFIAPTIFVSSSSSEEDVTNIPNIEPTATLHLSEYALTSEIIEIYEFPPIRYLTSGMFGDFILLLSVICEHFYNTGRKGVLYVTDKIEFFRFSLPVTYQDTYPLLMHQKYIKSYQIHSNEIYDIDLTFWRKELERSQNLSLKLNWYQLLKNTYQVEWGLHLWIDCPISEITMQNKIIINTTHYRWPIHLDFNKLLELYPDDLLFISTNPSEYQIFLQKTSFSSTNIPFIEIQNFNQLCSIVQSCKLFVGSLSGPLTIAFAFKKQCVIGLCEMQSDNDLNMYFNSEHVRYEI